MNAKSWDGETPLDYTYGNKEIADLLRKHGAKTGRIESCWQLNQLLPPLERLRFGLATFRQQLIRRKTATRPRVLII